MWPLHGEPSAVGHAATRSSRGDLAAVVTRPGLLRPDDAAETDHGRIHCGTDTASQAGRQVPGCKWHKRQQGLSSSSFDVAGSPTVQVALIAEFQL